MMLNFDLFTFQPRRQRGIEGFMPKT